MKVKVNDVTFELMTHDSFRSIGDNDLEIVLKEGNVSLEEVEEAFLDAKKISLLNEENEEVKILKDFSVLNGVQKKFSYQYSALNPANGSQEMKRGTAIIVNLSKPTAREIALANQAKIDYLTTLVEEE